jgi:hypothetical protein
MVGKEFIMNLLNLNWWVIAISLVINMAGGMLWYGPLLGKQWMKGMGIDPENKEQVAEMQKDAGPGYAFSALGAIVFGYVVEMLINNLIVLVPGFNLIGALGTVMLLYFGFSLPNTLKPVLWGEQKRSVFLINTGFEVVSSIGLAIVAFTL